MIDFLKLNKRKIKVLIITFITLTFIPMWPTLSCGSWECWSGFGSLWSSLLSSRLTGFLDGANFYKDNYPSYSVFMFFILKKLAAFLVLSYIISISYVKIASRTRLKWLNSKPYWLKGGVLAIILFLALTIALIIPLIFAGVSMGNMGGGLIFLTLLIITHPLTYTENIISPIFLILPYIFLLGALIGFVIEKIKSRKNTP